MEQVSNATDAFVKDDSWKVADARFTSSISWIPTVLHPSRARAKTNLNIGGLLSAVSFLCVKAVETFFAHLRWLGC